jgi:hypothetical protein
MTNQNDRIAKLEAAIAELEEMVNAREIDLIHLRAELARLRPLAELYPLAWEECKKWRQYDIDACDHACDPPVAPADAHDKARAERGVE